MLAIFAFTVYYGFRGASGPSETWQNTKDFLQVVLPSETGLLGTVTGYFFGKGK